MKKIAALSIIALLALTLGSAFSQPSTTTTTTTTTTTAAVPTSMPIGSREAFAAYAYSQVSGGQTQVYGDSMLQATPQSNYFTYWIKDIGQLLPTLSQTNFSFGVESPADPVSTWTQLTNSKWQTFFYASQRLNPVHTTSGWKIIATPAELRINEWAIPLDFPNATSARLVFRDANGYIYDSLQLDVYDGVIYYQTAFVGFGSYLEVTTSDPSTGTFVQYAYDVKNKGQQITPTLITGQVPVYIQNLTSFSDAGYAVGVAMNATQFALYADDGSAAVPAVHVVLGGQRPFQLVSRANPISGVGTIKYPTSFWVYQLDTDGNLLNQYEIQAAPGGTGSVNVPQLAPGMYNIIPNYGELFHKKVQPVIYHRGGNEKG